MGHIGEDDDTTGTIRVFLLDDHEIVRRGVRELLESAEGIEVAGEASTADEALLEAVLAGAAGYLLKQVRGSDLFDAVRRVAAGQSLLDPAVTARVLERLRSGPQEDERLARLTEQERKILDLIAEGLTNRQIADQMFLAEKTIKNYVSNLLAKLGMERRTEAAVYAARLAERRGK